MSSSLPPASGPHSVLCVTARPGRCANEWMRRRPTLLGGAGDYSCCRLCAGFPPVLGLPLPLGGLLLPNLCTPPPVLGLAWEETSVAPPGSRNGVMTSRCAGKRPAPPPGAARPSGSVGAGPIPFPPSDTGLEECPALNGPCVKLLGGGQSPRTPPRQGQSKSSPLAVRNTWSSAHTEKGPVQTPHVPSHAHHTP